MTEVFFIPRRAVSDAVAYACVLLVGMVRKKYPPLRPSSVKGLAVEQHVICTTFDGAVTEEMIGPVTPEEMVPVKAGTRSTSTRYLAASTPTVGWPWSSRRMNCTGQPLTPPPWLTCSIASSADCAIFLVIGAIEPVSGRMPPIFTEQLCAAAVAADSTPAISATASTTALPLCRSIVSFLCGRLARRGPVTRRPAALASIEPARSRPRRRRASLIVRVPPDNRGLADRPAGAKGRPSVPGQSVGHVPRDHRGLADQSAWTEEQHQQQEQPDQDDLDRGALRGAARRHQLADEDAGARPDGPDDERAEQGAAVVAAAAHDEHGPDLEGDDRQEVERADEADEADVERAGQPHEGRAQDERLEPEAPGALAERDGGGLVLANRLQHAAPGRHQDAVERPVDRDHEHDHQAEKPEIEAERGVEQVRERLADAREPLRAAGQRLPVEGDELDRDGHAERGDGQIVAPQANRDQADQPAGERRRRHRGQHAHEPGQAEVTDVLGLRRRGQDRVRVGANRVEPHDARVEQPGEAPLKVQGEREDAQDEHDAREEHEVREHLFPLAEDALRPQYQDGEEQQERRRALVARADHEQGQVLPEAHEKPADHGPG